MKVKAQGDDAGVAALSLVQGLFHALRARGVLEAGDVEEIVDWAVELNEQPPPDGSFAEPNERVALLLREIFQVH